MKPSNTTSVGKLSKIRRPEGMTLEQWQIALRRNFGRSQKFCLKQADDGSFMVSNPQSGGRYHVRIHGKEPGNNHCTCPDFLVNTLGTCKHIEFAVAKLARKRKGNPFASQSSRPKHAEIVLRYGTKRDILFRPGSMSSHAFQKITAAFFYENGILRQERYRDFDQFLKKARELDPTLYCHREALSFLTQVRDQETLGKRISQAFPQGADSPIFRTLLKTTLYPYQRKGALFAAKAGRCIIADDMGLGKTIQAIAGAEILARTMGIERVLIVCPTSLKHQWKQEIDKFTGRSAEIVEGLLHSRARRYQSTSFFKIVNYDVIHHDLPQIREWAPDLIILDEAQRIKNWKTRTAKSVKQLPSEYAFVLTGTPLENRLEELHSIVEFVDRFHLGPSFRFLAEHQILDDHGKVVGYRNLSKITETLKTILLRRTKAEVLKQLPQRVDKNLFVAMTPQQTAYHEENGNIVARIVAKWRRSGFLTEKDQQRLMIALQNMRMSCNSTYLLDGKTDHGVKTDELKALLSEALESSETKVVIFSQWIRTHELIIRRLERMRLVGKQKPGFVFLHGGLSSPERRKIIQQFKEDPGCRVFLSTDAGGVGLNLQSASMVINMDQPWNPAVLEQRIGRVHRLGQSRPVRVVNFISEGTIEQGMLALLSFKKSLFAGVLDGGQDEVFLGGTRLKRFMESVEKVSGDIPVLPTPIGAMGESQKTGSSPDLAVASATHGRKPQAVAPIGAEASQAAGELLAAGLNFLEKLGAALEGPSRTASLASLVVRDEANGKSYLKIPCPSGDALNNLTSVIQKLSNALRAEA